VVESAVVVRGAVIGLALLLTACEGKRPDVASMPDAKARPAAAAATAAALPAETLPPEGAEPVDAALAAAKVFNEAAPIELAAIGEQEAKIRAAAARALTAARGAEAAGEGQRQGLTARIAAARREADAARKVLTDNQAKWKIDGEAQTAAVQTAVDACAANEVLAAYAGCVALTTEQALMATNIEALSARYQAADAAYGLERVKLEEAAASLALAALR
jgi:hypothetical protein